MVILSNQSVRMYSILTGGGGVDVCIHVSYLRLQEEREPSSQSPPSERSLLPDTQTTLHIGNIVPVGEKCMFGKRLHKLASFVPPFHNFTLSLITVSNTVSWSSFKCFCPVRWGMNCRCRIKWFIFFLYKSAICLPKRRRCRKALIEAGGHHSLHHQTAVETTTEHVPDVWELLCGTWKTTIETAAFEEKI